MTTAIRIHLRRHGKHWLILLGLVLALELGLRLALPEPVHTYFYGLGGELWDEDPELFWKPVDGWSDAWAAVGRADPARLIVSFGGSILTNHIANTNFLTELQTALPGWTVANFATGGYTTHQSLVMWRRVRARQVPTIVIVSHAFNDRSPGFAPDREMAERNRRPSVRALHAVSQSKIVQAWRRLMWKLMGYDPYAVNPQHPNVKLRVSLGEYEANLTAFVSETAAAGSQLVLITQANLDPAVRGQLEPHFALMRRLAAESAHVYYLDIRPDLFAVYERDLGFIPGFPNDNRAELLLHNDACHYSDAGHKLIAARVEQFLVDEKLVEKLPTH
jgi:hypothetical protein